MLYMYGMRLRPVGIGAQPKDFAHVDCSNSRYWNVLYYERELSGQEMYNYNLDYLGRKGERMKKEFWASVTVKGSKEEKIIKEEWSNKKDFEKELRERGYKIRFITTEDKYEEAKAKWDNLVKTGNEEKRLQRIAYHAEADKLGMTVKAYYQMMKDSKKTEDAE